jgi:hypothetical protein
VVAVEQNPSCVLCPKKLPNLTRPAKKHGATYDFDFLHAMKPTEGYKWAHILCSLFIPEVMYTDSNRLRVTEGISALPLERWTAVSPVVGNVRLDVVPLRYRCAAPDMQDLQATGRCRHRVCGMPETGTCVVRLVVQLQIRFRASVGESYCIGARPGHLADRTHVGTNQAREEIGSRSSG